MRNVFPISVNNRSFLRRMGEKDERGEEAGHRGIPNGFDSVRTSTVEGGGNR